MLQKLALPKQECLMTLALQCQSLQEVDLADCGSLIDCICAVFSDVGGCPMLKILVLDNCKVCELILVYIISYGQIYFWNTLFYVCGVISALGYSVIWQVSA